MGRHWLEMVLVRNGPYLSLEMEKAYLQKLFIKTMAYTILEVNEANGIIFSNVSTSLDEMS